MNDSRDQAQSEEPKLIFDGGKKGRFFIIDYGEHMFLDGGWRFRIAIQAVREQINSLACTGDLSELCSVIFVNTGKTNDLAQNYECIFVHRELTIIDAEYVKELDAILQNEDLQNAMQPLIGVSGLCDWADLFYLCRRIFQYSGHVLRKKFISIFTTDAEEIENKEKIKTHIDNFQEIGARINVFLIEHKREETENTQFWMTVDHELSRFSNIDDLNESLHFKHYALRASTSIPFVLCEGFEFAVGIYHLIKPRGKPSAVLMNSETNERVEQRAHYIPTDEHDSSVDIDLVQSTMSADERFEGEINFQRNIGGVDVILDREELEKLRRFDRPGITVIGFKPLFLLKTSHRMSSAKYIYPLENVINGSSNVYRALFKRCLDRSLFILVRFTQKTNTSPQLCALVPQSVSHEGNNITLPTNYFYEGFHLLELPFAEEARNLCKRYETPIGGIGKWPAANKEQVKVAKEFVSKLTTRFSPDQFFNPVLQRHYKAIETVALDLDFDIFKEEAENFDKLKPYYKNTTNADRVSSELAKMKELCCPCEQETNIKQKRGCKKEVK